MFKLLTTVATGLSDVQTTTTVAIRFSVSDVQTTTTVAQLV